MEIARTFYYPKYIQNILSAFGFFLAFPGMYLIGNSITFFIFIYLVYITGKYKSSLKNGKILFQIFITLTFVSFIFAPYKEMPRHPGLFGQMKVLIQFVYWNAIAIFFLKYSRFINMYQFCKWIFYGTIVSIVGFYFFPFTLNLSVITLTSMQTRNGLVFTLLCSIPLSFYYLYYRYGAKKLFIFMLLFLFAMLLTNGRSGAAIIIIVLLLVSYIIYPNLKKTIRIFILPLIIIGSLSQELIEKGIYDASFYVETVNPRIAELMRGKEESEGDLSFDRSWLIRLLMVDKGLEIAGKHPIIGVGPNNFTYYDGSLQSQVNYQRLALKTDEYYNSRSAHNAYIQQLAELGYPGLIILVLILLFPIILLVKKLILGTLNINNLALISLLAIGIHFYAISALTGAIPFLIFGLAWNNYNTEKLKKIN